MGVMTTLMIVFARDTSDCERLYSLDALGVEDRGDTNSKVLNEFKENISSQVSMDFGERSIRDKQTAEQNRKLGKTPELK